MPLYRRKWNCGLCGKPVVWDSDKKTLTCGCRTETNVTFVNMEAFELLPKYARHVSEKLELNLDSFAFTCPKCGSYVISDRSKNENPQLHVSFIKYPREDGRLQARLAVSGSFHVEQLNYNVKPAENWKEKAWLIISEQQLVELLKFLDWKNPGYVHAWM
jgi:endogenous inhibitor of DNA gyrase (YacG/DUF329 family)